MIIELDRAKKKTVLRWLQRGTIDTSELPEIERAVQIEVITKPEEIDDECKNSQIKRR